jgi:hypothetical protein
MYVSELIRQLRTAQKEVGDVQVRLDASKIGLVTVRGRSISIVSQSQLNKWLGDLDPLIEDDDIINTSEVKESEEIEETFEQENDIKE